LKLLLDTQAMLWAVGAPTRLRPATRAAIEDPESDVVVSAVSVWEAAIKRALGKLEVAPLDLRAELDGARFSPLPVTWEHGLAAGALPRHHGDPFDRMLIAQAQLEGLTLVTSDHELAAYDVALLPA
jgi:PIN domain nuclease of toxin-antitoxin system